MKSLQSDPSLSFPSVANFILGYGSEFREETEDMQAI